MRSILFALALALSVSSTALAQQYATVAPEAESSRAKSANSYLERGNTWFKKGEFERAIADYSLAIAFDAGFAGSYCNRGVARALKGSAERARSDIDQAIKLDANEAQTWVTRGMIRVQERDYSRALADFDQAIKLNTRLAEAWHNRAVMLLLLDRLPGAEADFARLRELGGKLKPEAEQLWRELKERIEWRKSVLLSASDLSSPDPGRFDSAAPCLLGLWLSPIWSGRRRLLASCHAATGAFGECD
jgi:tetratricopeptide (TPR) repeat protein